MKPPRIPAAVRLLGALVLAAVPALAVDAPPPTPPTRARTAQEDTPSFTRLPDYVLTDSRDSDFEAFDFYDGKACITIEGKKYERAYILRDGAPAASDSQIIRHYANALESMGGTVLFDGACSSIQCLVRCDSLILIGKVLRAETEMWVAVAPAAQGSEYDLTLVKRETMQQDTSASRLFATIQRDGHAALYIQFVSRQSAIRADSQPLILQVTQMLEDHPDLRLSIEAHTDDAGTVESNRTLSAHRAAAVLSALVAQGIEAQRLIAVGRGQEQPIADNRTEEGRARNRRIELVKK